MMDDKKFREWFGDSKITKNGEPMIVYHGTDADFKEFDRTRMQQNFGTKVGKGIFFSESLKYAQGYGKNIVRAYLKIENPYVFDNYQTLYHYIENSGNKIASRILSYRYFCMDYADRLKYLGHDGTVYRWRDDEMIEISVFDPGQIWIIH